MAATFRAESFVAFHGRVADAKAVDERLHLVLTELATARVPAAINNLRAQRTALLCQAAIARADELFRLRRYEEALEDYRQVSKTILGLIEPKFSHFQPPLVWPEGALVTRAMTQVAAGLMTHVVPDEREVALVLPDSPSGIDPVTMKASPLATLSVTTKVSDAGQDLAAHAATAVSQGRYPEAAEMYSELLRAAPADGTQFQAEVLLNLAACEVQSNRYDAALRNLANAQRLFQRTGDQLGVAEAQHNTGLAHLRAGKGEEAIKALEAARKTAGEFSLLGLLERENTPPPSRRLNLTLPLINLRAASGVSALSRAETELSQPPRRLTTVSEPPQIDTGELAEALGSHDLALKLRPIGNQVAGADVRVTTPAQERLEDFGRTIELTAGAEPVRLSWTKQGPLSEAALTGVYQKRTAGAFAEVIGVPIHTPIDVIVNLPHLYHLVLPIKMGDCYQRLGEFAAAQEQYLRAARYQFINLEAEAPNLWQRLAENVLAWGDSLYREEETQQALPIYGLIMTPQTVAANSVLYTTVSLAPTGAVVKGWIEALVNGTPLPDLNPAVAHVLHSVRKRWAYINAGLDFFGDLATAVPPFTFKYLQEVARYFAQRAIQGEQRYIDFYTRFEQGQMTRREIQNANEVARLGVEVAQQNEAAAQATVAAAQASVALADLRHTNAQDQLDEFNDVAWELESLAGHIARGSAWTGGDLPNLHYSAEGRYDFDGPKHEVLQKLTSRQTAISNDLQRQRMQDTIAELNAARGISQAQRAIADARLAGARIETQIAQARARQSQEMLDAFNSQLFNPEQWLAMAGLMRVLSATALDRAIEVGRLMQKAYNFEQFDNRRVIRSTYNSAATNDLLGGEILLSDIDSFTHYHVTRVKQKPIPVKWALSLPEEFPGQFLQFTRTGVMQFDVDLQRAALAHPGTYRQQLIGVELEVDGFVPPVGLHGRLTNSGLGRYRDSAGAANLRVQPAETLVLSRYSRRQDAIILTPPPEMRALFEGNSVASGWTLEVPKSLNDADLNLIFDVRLVLYFECLFDATLFAQDTQPPAALTLTRSRGIYLKQHFPDAYFQLREHGVASVGLAALDFPRNQANPVLQSLALALVPAGSASLAGANLSVRYPGQAAPVAVAVTAEQAVPKAALPIVAGTSACGTYQIQLAEADQARKDDIDDLVLVLDYQYAQLA